MDVFGAGLLIPDVSGLYGNIYAATFEDCSTADEGNKGRILQHLGGPTSIELISCFISRSMHIFYIIPLLYIKQLSFFQFRNGYKFCFWRPILSPEMFGMPFAVVFPFVFVVVVGFGSDA